MFSAAFRIASEDLVVGGGGGCVKREDSSVKMAEGGNKEESERARRGIAARAKGRTGWMNHIPRCEKTPGLLSCHGSVWESLRWQEFLVFLPQDFIGKTRSPYLFRQVSDST